MTILSSLGRRAFLASQAALAMLASMPGAASATTGTGSTTLAGGSTPAPGGPVRWDIATADHLEQFIGDRFRVQTQEHGSFVLRLTAVERSDSGPHRPAHLRRAEGVAAVFDSPDAVELAGLGHQVHRMSHPRIGKADLFMGPTPTRDGRPVIELILN